ncbi:MAG: two-component sensor histidine kinase [Tissierellia bacterium]|nr:two-component sensor histidine kinase [Tissierellia bacterium]
MEKKIYRSMFLIGFITFLVTVFLLSYTFTVLLKDNIVNKLEVISYAYEDSIYNKEIGESIHLKDNIVISLNSEKKENKNYYIYNKELNNGKILQVSQPKSQSRNLIYTGLIITIPILIFIIITFGAISYYATKHIMEPIKNAVKKMDNSEDKNLDRNMVYKELRPFVDKINRNVDIVEDNIIKLKQEEEFRREFTANISHELKTPLTSINGYAEMLESNMVKQEDIPRIAGIIHKQGNKLLEIIDSVIKLSNLDDIDKKVEFEEINLNIIVEEVIRNLDYRLKQKSIKCFISGEKVDILANKRMIEDLIYNLVDNAIKYNKEGGTIEINFSKERHRKVLTIKDTGIGVSKDDLGRIFERFYMVDKSRSGKQKGTGLGLSIVKHIVEMHQAKIYIESELGEGTKITLKF